MVKILTDANFETETKNGVVLVDFWATWCGPCRMQSPIIDELDEEIGDKVTFAKMDVDANPQTPSQFGIMGIPTLLIKKDGQVVEKLVGYHAKEMHFDFQVPNVPLAVERAISLGARRAETQFGSAEDEFVTMFDPSGHPFCLCADSNIG